MAGGHELWLAPLRGVTVRAFREAFAGPIAEAGFSGAFAPFLPANPGIRVTDRMLADLVDGARGGCRLVPQVITKHPDAMRELLKGFKGAGFARADLNAGCPFPMIRRRGRGSGLFRTPDVLDRLLEAGCEEMGPGAFSLKIRLGLERPDELAALMPVINRYPLAVLTIHARTAKQMYEGECDVKSFRDAAALSANPVMYNGDVTMPPQEDAPAKMLMVGRSFVRKLGGRDDAAELLERYIDISCKELCGDRPVLGRMKELLAYWREWPRWRRLWPVLKLCRTVEEMRLAVRGRSDAGSAGGAWLRVGVLACAIAGAVCGCRSAQDYRKEADETAAAYLAEGQRAAVGRTEPIDVETPAETLRRRLMIDQKLLVKDPASFGIRDIPTNLYWRVDERMLPGGEDAAASVWHGGTNALEIGLVDAVRIAAFNSREYKSRKEALFRSALGMDLEDDIFRNIFSGSLRSSMNVSRDENERDALENHSVSHNESATFGVSRRFRNGARLTGSIMANIAGMLTGDTKTAWGSSADLSVSIPLLRGSGELVNSESLTQAQRSFIYEVRAFEQYKRTFICQIESAYLALVLAKRRQQNQDEAFRRVIRSTRRSYRMAEASRMSQSQFEQAHQSELASKASWIASCQSYETTKDSFKMTLGLPPDARIEPREDDLVELERYVGRVAKLEAGEYDMGDDDENGKIVLDEPDSVDGGDLKARTDRAIDIAFSNRLDFVSCRDRVEDAQRKLLIAEDALRAEITLGASISNVADPASPGMRRSGTSHGRIHPREWSTNPLLTVDLPVERRRERNAYRNALIAVESAVREYQQEEDSLKNTIRADMRSMSQTKDNLQIQYMAMNLAERRVRNQEILLQAGRADMTVMLEAQDSLVQAKNSLYSAMINYKNQELALQRDLGLLEVSVNGTWKEADLVALGVLPKPEPPQRNLPKPN